MRRGIRILSGIWLHCLRCSFAGAEPVHYTLTDFGTLGGTTSVGWGINNAGQVVGGSQTANNAAYHGFIYDGIQIQDLGVPAGWTGSTGFAVNDLGQAVGTIGNESVYHAAFFPGPGMAPQDLGTLDGLRSGANAINTSGLIAGYSEVASGRDHPTLFSSGQVIDLGLPAGFVEGRAEGINEAGQVVGFISPLGGATRSFLYLNGQMTVLNRPGDPVNSAKAINNVGQVVGSAYFSAGLRAFLYSSGLFHDLGTLGSGGSQAYAINDFGQIVGYGHVPGDGNPHAWIYSGSGPLIDLNSLIDNPGGLKMISAYGINNNGQIAALASSDYPNSYHAVLLTPVPEPHATFIVALLSFSCATPRFALHYRSRRRRRSAT